MSKICSKCKLLKSRSSFGKNKTRKDGLQFYCKECSSLFVKQWRENNPEKAVLISIAATRKWNSAYPEKRLATSKRWQANNPEKVLAMRQRDRKNNPEKYRLRNQTYYLKTIEVRNIKCRKWHKDNPVRARINVSRRRAKKLQATPAWANNFFISEIYHLAQLRSQLTGVEHQVDHIVPLQSDIVCGLHWEYNLQVIPATLNLQKHNSYWPNMP